MISIIQALRSIGVSVEDNVNPFQIHCPFHGSDQTPSARVYPADNSLYCFTCKRSYNPIAVIAASNGIEYREAARLVAETYGSGKLDASRPTDRLNDVLARMVNGVSILPIDQRHKVMPVALEILARAARGDQPEPIMNDARDFMARYFPRAWGG